MSGPQERPSFRQIYRQQYRRQRAASTSTTARIVSGAVAVIVVIAFLLLFRTPLLPFNARHSPVVALILGVLAAVLFAAMIAVIVRQRHHEGHSVSRDKG